MNIFYNNSIKESLDTIMGATMKPSCKIHWYSEAAQKYIPCEGPTYYENAHQIHWPHTVTFIFGGQTIPISKLESKCVHDDKNLILQGIMLFGSNHLTTATRCPKGWMFYDGMMTPKFIFYSSRDVNKLLELQFLELGIYEVADADAESRPDVDWGALFRSENEYPFDMLEDDNTTTTVELIKRIDQKIDSPGINKEKGMAEAHTDTDVQNPTLKQHGDNTKTQKTRQSKIQFSTVMKETTMNS